MQSSPIKKMPDFATIIIVFLLVGLGVVMVYSSSYYYALTELGDSTYYVKRQLMWVVIGIGAMVITMNIPYWVYKKLLPVLLGGLFIAMLLVSISPLGVSDNYGAQRWLSLGVVSVQPAEFVKLGLIIYLAAIYSKKQSYMNQFWRGVFPPLVIVGIFFGLTLLQRDLGTAMTFIAVTIVIVYVSGARLKHLIALGIVAVSMFYFFVTTVDYRLDRLLIYRDPWMDPTDTGYQLVQSLLAIGYGGLTGSGFGDSIQKFLYLPEAHTDFIFSIFAEEFGFIGVCILIILYLVFIIRGISISNRSPDSYSTLLGFGIVSLVAVQTLVNIGGVSTVIPLTGIPLPFLSSGGSSLVLMLAAVGILLNISTYEKTDATPETEINTTATK